MNMKKRDFCAHRALKRLVTLEDKPRELWTPEDYALKRRIERTVPYALCMVPVLDDWTTFTIEGREVVAEADKEGRNWTFTIKNRDVHTEQTGEPEA